MSSLHNPLNFFKVILPATLEEGKLPLPKGFVRKYGKTLSNKVLIELPNGGKWEMNWTMHDDQIWLENGWKEFVKFYSISAGYFLVFKHEGNSHFQVLIFDTNCLEIAYPVLLGIDDDEDDDESNKSDSVEVIYACNKARPKSPVPCPRTNPVVETAHFDCDQAESSRIGRKRRQEIKTHLDIGSAQKRFKGNGGGSFSFEKHSKCETKRSKQSLSFQKSFDVQMHPTYLTTNCLRLPCNQSMNYLSKINEETIILQVSDGKTWPVSYKFSNGRGTLTNGWLSFVRENNLKRGDVCSFKIIESNGISFVVSIRRVNEMSNSPLSQGEWATNKPSSVFHEQVPRSMHTKSEVQKACSQFKSDGSPNSHMKAKVSRIERKKLEKTETHLDIDAARKRFKGNGGGTFNSGEYSKCETKRGKQPLSCKKPLSFDVQMHPTYLTTNCLYLPYNQGINYLSKNEGTVILQVSDGKTWPVSYKFCSGRGRLTNGWLSFVRANNLKEGDVCSFKMIESNAVSFVVSIWRANKVSSTPLSQGEWATNKPSSSFYEQVRPSMHIKSEAQNACGQFKSDNSFPIFIRSCLLKNTRPSIPIDFVRRYIRQNGQCVTLQAGTKSWRVKLVCIPNKSCARFSTGWSSFVRECGLKAGDVCHFQLIDEDEGKLVLKISVEKHLDQDA